MLTVGLHERHVSTAWAISVVVGGNRRPTTGAGRSTMREAQGDTNLPAKGPDLYRIEAELKLLVLRLLDVLDEFPACGTDNISETVRRWVLPWRNARYRSTTVPAAIILILNGTKPHPIRRVYHPNNHCEYLRCPFGIINTPVSF
jgi:hypothetical protein